LIEAVVVDEGLPKRAFSFAPANSIYGVAVPASALEEQRPSVGLPPPHL
jgi:hypothetical protein